MQQLSKRGAVSRIAGVLVLVFGMSGYAQANDKACSDVIFDLGMVASWITFKAVPGTNNADRWIKNYSLSPLFEYRDWYGQNTSFFDSIFYGTEYASEADYLSPQQAAAQVMDLYKRIYKKSKPREGCEFTLENNRFIFSQARRHCVLGRGPETQILELECTPQQLRLN